MPTSVNHHIGLRVETLERSIQFYTDVFGGRLSTQPMEYGPPDAGEILDGPPDLSFRVCHVTFDDGTIELFELSEPHRTTTPIPATQGGIIHYALQVDDVDAALVRVERSGASACGTTAARSHRTSGSSMRPIPTATCSSSSTSTSTASSTSSTRPSVLARHLRESRSDAAASQSIVW